MCKKFTSRAQKVMELANQEALTTGSEFIDTDHVLFGLLKEGSGVGAIVLKILGVDIEEAKKVIGKRIKIGRETGAMGRLLQALSVKKVIEWATEEARSMKVNYIGTEHILLGLLRKDNEAEEPLAYQILGQEFGVFFGDVRREVLGLLLK
ncbi:MAG: Clp protease N-terminal domain-containing protein [bacterium]|nr:Clp protease N-terminal domain-containing protein [bacterium]